LAIRGDGCTFIRSWLTEILSRAKFSYEANGKYPCVLSSYNELLEHPKSRDNEYRRNATSASILFPVIALWAALIKDAQLYSNIASLKRDVMPHCTFQLWYPDETSEANYYRNDEVHGATFASLDFDKPVSDFLDQVFRECDETPHFQELSAVRYGWWPLIVVACRHYRLPLPLHILQGLREHGRRDCAVSADEIS
jgi:hypothetical protein